MKSHNLIHDLITQTDLIKSEGIKLNALAIEKLNMRHSENAWSILECVAHMNLYGDYYLPAMASAIQNAKDCENETFRSGWLGNYFANSMLPKDNLNKMKTFKDKDPIGKNLEVSEIKKFIEQQTKLLELLKKAESVSLNNTKVSTSISKWIKMNLGDTFRFFINHNLRHLKQISDILS